MGIDCILRHLIDQQEQSHLVLVLEAPVWLSRENNVCCFENNSAAQIQLSVVCLKFNLCLEVRNLTLVEHLWMIQQHAYMANIVQLERQNIEGSLLVFSMWLLDKKYVFEPLFILALNLDEVFYANQIS